MLWKYTEAKLLQNDVYIGQCHEKKLNAQLNCFISNDILVVGP